MYSNAKTQMQPTHRSNLICVHILVLSAGVWHPLVQPLELHTRARASKKKKKKKRVSSELEPMLLLQPALRFRLAPAW